MKLAVAQVIVSDSKNENIKKAKDYAEKSNKDGVDILVFPETFMVDCPSTSTTKLADVAESMNGPFVNEMKAIASGRNIYLLFGMYEKKEGENKRAYNSIVLLNRQGEIVHKYRKTHLYDAFVHKESNRVIPGTEEFPVVETDIGKIGLMICYELRFPEISRKLVLEGADIIIVPTAWVAGDMKDEHWSTLLKARAIENTTYVAGANQIGNIYSGTSMIYDPMGVRIASAGEEEALIIAEIDIERTDRVREKLPCLKNRRPELYTVN